MKKIITLFLCAAAFTCADANVHTLSVDDSGNAIQPVNPTGTPVPLTMPGITGDGDVILTTTTGAKKRYFASASTAAARGTALSTAIAAHSAGDLITLAANEDFDTDPIELKSGDTLDLSGSTIRLKAHTLPWGIGSKSSGVTISIASPGVVTWTGHGFANGYTVVFQTTGALPTGLTANTLYYIINVTTNTFQVSATLGGSAINTSGTQSGSHTGFGGSNKGAIIWGISYSRADNLTIKNGLFDCNVQNQPALSNAGAMSIYAGDNVLVENCRGINAGTQDARDECFVFYVSQGNGLGVAHSDRIVNCRVDTPAPIAIPGGFTAISISSGGCATTNVISDGWMLDGEITGCTVRDITAQSSGTGHPAYVNGYGMGAFTYGLNIHDNYAYNLKSSPITDGRAAGIYADSPLTIKTETIKNNHLIDVDQGIYMQPVPSTTYPVDSITIDGNVIRTDWQGIRLTMSPGGAAVTITIASPGVVTWNAHGFSNGQPMFFTTSGALPTGLTANTVYYLVNVTTNTFQVAATVGGSAINTSGSQSGTQVAQVYSPASATNWYVKNNTIQPSASFDSSGASVNISAINKASFSGNSFEAIGSGPVFLGTGLASITGVAVPYSLLPASATEGSLADVTDSNTATWGANAASGGSNHVKVRWNGSAWTVVGK